MEMTECTVTVETPEIVAAAAWWRAQLEETHFQDNGDGLQSMVLSSEVGNLAPLPKEQLDNFEAILRAKIVEFLRNKWNPEKSVEHNFYMCLSTDYSPEYALLEAAMQAGIPDRSKRFPIKTCLWIEQGDVRAKKGYRAASKQIYPASEGQS